MKKWHPATSFFYMQTELISVLIGVVAPFVFSLLGKIGLKGVAMLWVTYGLSVGLAFLVNFVSGELNLADVGASVALIVATSQTIFHTFKSKLK